MRTGGCPAGLIGQLLAETRIEALPAAPDGGLEGIEEWVTDQAQQMAGQLLSGGQVSVATSRGTLRASLKLPGRLSPAFCWSTKAATMVSQGPARPG